MISLAAASTRHEALGRHHVTHFGLSVWHNNVALRHDWLSYESVRTVLHVFEILVASQKAQNIAISQGSQSNVKFQFSQCGENHRNGMNLDANMISGERIG